MSVLPCQWPSECSRFRCGQLLWGLLLSCPRTQSVLWTMVWRVCLVSDIFGRLRIISHGRRLVLGYNSEWFFESRFSLFQYSIGISVERLSGWININSSIMLANSLWQQCNINEDLILTTAQLMKSLGLQVSTFFFYSDCHCFTQPYFFTVCRI